MGTLAIPCLGNLRSAERRLPTQAEEKPRPMALESVVLCAGGVQVAQRGAERPRDTLSLWVGPTTTVPPSIGVPVEARRIDGVVWRRHWSEPVRLVIDFVDLVRVAVDDTTGSVVFDRELYGEMEQHLLLDHVLPLVLARRGRLVLHGAVISRHGNGVVLMGASGSGKSTLTAFAWQQGWTVGGDDGAVLSVTDPPTAEPTYATVRLTPASLDLLGIDPVTSSAVAGKMRLGDTALRRFHPGSVELSLIVSLEPAAPGESSALEPLDSAEAHARLFGSTFHAELSGTRLLPSVVDDLASVVETTTVARLIVGRGVEGLASAESLLRGHLDGKPAENAVSARPPDGADA